MKIGIMQPYFMPYIGYWQLINSVDIFIIYDNIEYTKRGWIRRNRILVSGKDKLFTLPIKKDSDYLSINERYLSSDFEKERNKILNLIHAAYQKAPFFEDVFPVIKDSFFYESSNLFEFIYNSIMKVSRYIGLNTNIVISSSIDMDHNLKCEKRVIEICRRMEGDIYINPIGGVELYNKEDFFKQNIKLKFLKSNDIVYNQYDNEFIPNLSIIDVMMFNSKDEIREMLQEYILI